MGKTDDFIKSTVQEATNAAGTQHALAQKLGVTDGAVSQWLSGKAIPNTQKFIELLKIANRITMTLCIAVGISTFGNPQDANATQSTPYSAFTSGTLCIMLKNGTQ